MRTQNLFSVISVLLVVLVFSLPDARAAEPTELTALRKDHATQLKGATNNGARQSVFHDYIQKLTSLESNLRSNMQSRSSINAVRKELRATNKKVSELTDGQAETSSPTTFSVGKGKNKNEPDELVKLRRKYSSRKKGLSGDTDKSAIISEYIQKLTSLEYNLRSNMRPRESWNAVRREIRSARNDLSNLSATSEPAHPSAKPKPIVKAEKPIIEKITPPPVVTAEVKPSDVLEKKAKTNIQKTSTNVAVEKKPEQIVSVAPTVKPLSIPNIVPVIASATPVVGKTEVKSRIIKPVVSKPSPLKTAKVEKPKPKPKPVPSAPIVAPVSKKSEKSVAKPGRIVSEKAAKKPMTQAEAKPVSGKPSPVPVKTASVVKPKPAAPKPIPVPIIKTKPASARTPVSAKPAVSEHAAKPKQPGTPQQVFKPAAPKPKPVVASKPVSKPVKTVKEAAVRPLPSVPVTEKKPAAAESKPAAAKRSAGKTRGKTHVVETRGIAGKRSIRKDNIYTFNLDKPGTKSTLTFYAAGQHSNDTFGKIWVVNPNEQPSKVGKWKDGDFNKAADKVSSYKELKPVTVDISKYVSKPGKYKVEFEWTDFGKEPLVIFRVEINT